LGQGFFWVVRLAMGSSIAVEANVLVNCLLDPDLVVAPFSITAPPYSNLNYRFHAVRKIRDQSTVAKLATQREFRPLLDSSAKVRNVADFSAVSAQLHTQMRSAIPEFPPHRLSRSTSAPPQSMRWD
jgi:hypothetical protein